MSLPIIVCGIRVILGVEFSSSLESSIKVNAMFDVLVRRPDERAVEERFIANRPAQRINKH